MKRIECLWIVSAVSFLCSHALMAQTEKDITVNVTNIPAKIGKVLVATEEGKYYGMAEVTGSQTEVKLKNLPNGKYKLYVFHDANSNWELDKEGNVPAEYCATQNIDVTDSTRNLSVALVNIRERTKKNGK